MDRNRHHEDGRLRPPQDQWFMQHQPSMKQIMTIMAERDAAIQARNLALSDKKATLAERDLAIQQRDSAIEERNNAIIERDNAIAALQYREKSMGSGNISPYPPGRQMTNGQKQMHPPQQYVYHNHHSHVGEAASDSGDMCTSNSVPTSSATRGTKRPKQATKATSTRKPSKPKTVKRGGNSMNEAVSGRLLEWESGEDMGSFNDNVNKQLVTAKGDWKDQDLGLNQVTFDGSTMPVPVCSCTGVSRRCYRWSNGGWQSSCCTTNISMYPLPALPNKRHARVGGRKMSGNVFNKLLSRLAAEGHDLSNPVDLKDHWAKHGTNLSVTVK